MWQMKCRFMCRMISDNNNISIYKQDSIAGCHAVLGDKIMILRAVNNDCTLIFLHFRGRRFLLGFGYGFRI